MLHPLADMSRYVHYLASWLLHTDISSKCPNVKEFLCIPWNLWVKMSRALREIWVSSMVHVLLPFTQYTKGILW